MSVLSEVVFKRRFALNFYKNLSIPLAQMCFSKDFVNDNRGDMYPLLYKSEGASERIFGGDFILSGGRVERWAFSFFPYASYKIKGECLSEGSFYGLSFTLGDGEKAEILVDTKKVYCKDKNLSLPSDIVLNNSNDGCALIISARPGAFDIYFERPSGSIGYLGTVECEAFSRSLKYELFSSGYVSLCVSGDVRISSVKSYIDCGISQADIRPIRYENGEVMVEDGKIYLTVSIRVESGAFQGIFSLVPTTGDFNMTGAVFYDSGDGVWANDVAASVLYDRESERWRLWVPSFYHFHILGCSSFEGDIRFGVSVVDITLMERAEDGASVEEFKGFSGDEDPDFYYDKEKDKWYMAVCRLDKESSAYRYMFFESDSPHSGYKYIGKGFPGAETGGSFVSVKGERFFICGNSFSARSDYRIYSRDGMENARFDFPDGGFRGWGSLIPIKMGSRTRYFWLTFDRHKGSDYNWSYGNIYCFEGDI